MDMGEIGKSSASDFVLKIVELPVIAGLESTDSSGCIDNFLLACIERMTC